VPVRYLLLPCISHAGPNTQYLTHVLFAPHPAHTAGSEREDSSGMWKHWQALCTSSVTSNHSDRQRMCTGLLIEEVVPPYERPMLLLTCLHVCSYLVSNHDRLANSVLIDNIQPTSKKMQQHRSTGIVHNK
jgi:hypothetical protein